MRLSRLVSLVPALLLAACGGGSEAPHLLDAATPDAEPIPDAVPPPDACAGDYCAADMVCTDFTQDEQHCGDCDTSCSGGQYCHTGTCECPAPFVPSDPVLGLSQLQSPVSGLTIGFGLYADPAGGGPDALIVGIGTGGVFGTTTEGTYDLTDQIGTPPFMAAGYNVMLSGQTPTADAAVYATSGTITFTCISADGFTGHADNVHFAAVDSLTNPQIIPDGCSFDVALVNFAIGDCVNQ